MEQVAEASSQVRVATRQQRIASSRVVDAMEQVSVASRQVSTTAQEIAVAAGGQATMAAELRRGTTVSMDGEVGVDAAIAAPVDLPPLAVSSSA
jgi:methyl-accepting chemotaxis protein